MILNLAIWVMYFISIYFAVFWMTIIFENKISDGSIKKSGRLPFVTVAIPVYNEEESAIGTIESVLNLDYPRDKFEIIIVNDCSTDNTHKIISRYLRDYKGKCNIRYVVHKVNRGKGAALNTALHKSKGEFFVCLDADSFVEPVALKKMLPYLNDKVVAAVLPMMKLKNVRGFTLNLQYVEYLVNFFLKKVMGILDCIHVTPGPFALYRKKALLDVKCFDTNNLTEDLEMALKLQKNNYKIIQLIGPKVYTLGPPTMKAWFSQRNRWYKGTLINMFNYKKMLFNKNYGEFGMFQLPMVLGAAIVSIFFAFFVMWSNMIRPLLNKIYGISFINFNVGLTTSKWLERSSFLDINYMVIFFTLVIFLFGLAWILCGFKYTEEVFTKKVVVSTALFMVIYPFFLSLVWLGVVFDLVRGKVQRW